MHGAASMACAKSAGRGIMSMMAPRQFKDQSADLADPKKNALPPSVLADRTMATGGMRPDVAESPCPHCMQRALGNSYLFEQGEFGKRKEAGENPARTRDFAELPGSQELPPDVDLAQEPAPISTPSQPAVDVAEKRPCCDYDSFTVSGDSYTDTPTDCRKNIKFTYKMKSGGD